MKGFRFYLEYPNQKERRNGTRKKPGNHSGNVVAVATRENSPWTPHWHWSQNGYQADAIGAVFFERNSPVCGTSVGPGYLREKCKNISEALAREIHPQLFAYLDYDPA